MKKNHLILENKIIKNLVAIVPGNEDSFNAINGDGTADDDKLSFDRVFSLLLLCLQIINSKNQLEFGWNQHLYGISQVAQKTRYQIN